MLLRIMAKPKTFLAHLGQIQSLAQPERQNTVQTRTRGHTHSLLQLQASSGWANRREVRLRERFYEKRSRGPKF